MATYHATTISEIISLFVTCKGEAAVHIATAAATLTGILSSVVLTTVLHPAWIILALLTGICYALFIVGFLKHFEWTIIVIFVYTLAADMVLFITSAFYTYWWLTRTNFEYCNMRYNGLNKDFTKYLVCVFHWIGPILLRFAIANIILSVCSNVIFNYYGSIVEPKGADTAQMSQSDASLLSHTADGSADSAAVGPNESQPNNRTSDYQTV